ncbi:MAG TPA: hypothetical protein VHX44_05215 [Planctomycetota bacterium]|nr:hypothetical protein [Planctomycetota bacterium]
MPNHQIARGKSCVISIEFISSGSDQVIALSAATALQANAP